MDRNVIFPYIEVKVFNTKENFSYFGQGLEDYEDKTHLEIHMKSTKYLKLVCKEVEGRMYLKLKGNR